MFKYKLSQVFKYAFLSLLVSSFSYLSAQNRLSTPLEILTYMKSSSFKYQIEQLRGKLEKPMLIVLPNDGYVEEKDGKEYSFSYKDKRNAEAQKYVSEAMQLLSIEKGDKKKARKLLEKAINIDSTDAQLYALLGENYYDEKDYKKAEKYFRQAIHFNKVDYRAHWLLGEIFLKEEQKDSALHYIRLAHLRNRNMPRLNLRLKEVTELCGKTLNTNWVFQPLYKNYKEDSLIIIAADGVWLTYAMYHAVWKYEPGYLYIKSSQQVSDYLYHQEMEAMMGTYLTYSNLQEQDKVAYPSLKAFEVALDNDLLEAYIFYEILLVERPTLAHYLTEEFTTYLFEYLDKVRGINYH